MKLKKIVVIGPAGSYGGLQTHFSELQSFLRKEGHKVFAVKVYDDPLVSTPGKKANQAEVRPGRGIFNKCFKVINWIIAAIKARKFKGNIYVAVACGYGYSLAGRFIPKDSSRFFQIVTDDFRPADKTLMAMVDSFKNMAVQSGSLITPFREKMNYRGAIPVLPCFHQIISSELCANQAAADKEVKLAYFGRLAANKGLELLLKVLPAVKTSVRWKLDIFGRGPEEEKLRNLINASEFLSMHVRLMGSYPPGLEYSRLLSEYHGLVAPSQATEGLPLALLEAASVGLPFLSCRIGAIADCEEDNPDILIIDTGYESLSEGLRSFLENLINKRYNNMRLKSWFEHRHSKRCYEEIWRTMLRSPERFFSNE